VVPTVVVEEEEDSSIEVLASVEKKERDQAERVVAKPVLEMVGDRSGEEPDLMEVEEAVRTGDAPVREAVEEKTGAEPVSAGVSLGTGDLPVREVGEGDLFFEDYLGDDFEKVGEYTQEETSQTPLNPAPEHPTEPVPSSTKPRKKRIKTLAGRTDLPWVRKLAALKGKTSSSSKQTPQKQPSQPTRKSYRLDAQGVRSSSVNQGL